MHRAAAGVELRKGYPTTEHLRVGGGARDPPLALLAHAAQWWSNRIERQMALQGDHWLVRQGGGGERHRIDASAVLAPHTCPLLQHSTTKESRLH